MNSQIRSVCFDLGGVLVRICHSWGEACAEAGLSFRDPERLRSPELTSRRRLLVDRLQRGDLLPAEYYLELSVATESLYSESEVERIHEMWLLGEYPGVEELVSQLIPVVHTACLSNTNAVHWRRLVGDSSAFPNVARLHSKLASHELRAIKPGPKIFAIAEAELGVAADSILFFDDLEPNVRAARERGWHAETIDPHGDPVAQIRRQLVRYRVLSE